MASIFRTALIAVALLGVSVGVVAIDSAPASADPDVAGANCETNFWGTLFCDGPVRADGTWTRCLDNPGYTTWTGNGNLPIFQAPQHKCWVDTPGEPPPYPFTPDHHIGDGL